MPDHHRIAILLSRRLAGELSPAEKEELRLALEQDPLLRELAATLDGMKDAPPAGMTEREERQMMERGLRQWKLRASGLHRVSRGADGASAGNEAAFGVGSMGPHGEAENATAMEEATGVAMEKEVGAGRMLRIRMIRWSAAAAVVVLAAVGVYRYNSVETHAAPAVAWREVGAKYGTRSYLELPDGSKLWLNAGSKVRYATGARELTLSGEAFFDVKHDPAQPFLIHAGGLTVNVLGTSLNVRAYPGDSVVETTLIQGKAEITAPGQAIVLRPSEKVVMRINGATTAEKGNKRQPDFERHNVTADPTYKTIIETSWVEDKLIFRNEPFRDVASKLERWYNIRFHFVNGKYLDDKLTGYFKDQPIKNVMDGLQLSLGFHYEIAGDSILIK